MNEPLRRLARRVRRARKIEINSQMSRKRRLEESSGEFDPGSERTLADGLTHASRAGSNTSGERVRNT